MTSAMSSATTDRATTPGELAPRMEWLAESFLVAGIKARAHDFLLVDPIVYTIDEEAISRYQRRVLVR